jgi:cyclopropane-fatty-acyl-phospholipid synthase
MSTGQDLSPSTAPSTGLLDEGHASAQGARSGRLDRWLAQRLLSAGGAPPIRLVLWDGTEVAASGAEPVARMRLASRRTLWKLAADPGLHFGDAYSTGDLDVEGDLLRFLEAVYLASVDRDEPGLLRGQAARWLRRPRSNTLRGSRENIHHHYDIGNDFYRLWLDREMAYTCAYYPTPAATLEEAQVAKMHHVCRKLKLRPGESVVEAGCGWGALALFMARHYGVKVQAFNISREQLAYARKRARDEELSGQVEFVEDDYRNIARRFDAFVSVGMLEHVGKDHYRELGEVLHRCLGPAGRGLIHSIGRNQERPLNRWIEKRIFPGAYPPTLREMMEIFEPRDFSVLDVENLRLHYAKTLAHWLERYDREAGRVSAQFDRSFTRAWRLYLAGSAASFTTGFLQLFQVVFARSTHNQIPWTRAHLYQD